MNTEILLEAKRLGIEASKIVFSHKLEWIARDGKLALRKASIDHSGKITICSDAIRALDKNILDIFKDVVVAKGGYTDDEPRDDHGRWTDGGGSDDSDGDSGGGSAGVEFVSPNVASHLDFHQAVDAISSNQQQSLKDASEFIDKGLGNVATHHDIIGAWADGAENWWLRLSHLVNGIISALPLR